MNRTPMDPPEGQREPEILWTHLMDGIGIALDLDDGRMFVTDMAGTVYAADLDGSNRREILIARGNVTGIAHAVIPTWFQRRQWWRRASAAACVVGLPHAGRHGELHPT
ncbi:hypothetical protein ACFVXA_24590 [Streptomyces sp. NPDC058246]|uniref:hypothetical protein n=1 Tax=Streptomyces sp. NPDC058246 TaxID=3346400 RepID=UPI0036E61F93